jgi:hypothetical protein
MSREEEDIDTTQEHPALPAKISQQEQIKYLRNKGTNFIFLFGKQAIGKTAITASIIHYLNTECRYGSLEKNGNRAGQILWENIRQAIADGRFPDRTGIENVFEVESIFVPARNRTHLSTLSLTFLEMDGQSLAEVSVKKKGKLPSNIDIYFKAGDLSMTFIMITSHDEASLDDQLMVNFLDYLNDKSSRYREARVLLLVSKWDKYEGRDNVAEFLAQRMPQTFKRLSKPTNAYGVFSLGTIDDEVDESPFIQKYDSKSAKSVFEWIYQTLTGKQIG